MKRDNTKELQSHQKQNMQVLDNHDMICFYVVSVVANVTVIWSALYLYNKTAMFYFGIGITKYESKLQFKRVRVYLVTYNWKVM